MKQVLFERIDAELAPARAEYERLMAAPAEVERLLESRRGQSARGQQAVPRRDPRPRRHPAARALVADRVAAAFAFGRHSRGAEFHDGVVGVHFGITSVARSISAPVAAMGMGPKGSVVSLVYLPSAGEWYACTFLACTSTIQSSGTPCRAYSADLTSRS